MQYTEKLNKIKDDKGLTNSIISKAGDLALSTVTRTLNGSGKDASFETMVRIARGMGISLDELAGLKQPDEQPIASPIIETISSYAEILKEKDKRIDDLQDEKHTIRIEKYILIGILAILLIAVLTVLIVDLFNGHFGYITY